MAGTLYDLIGVSADASAEEIEAACLRLGEIYRPDKNPYSLESRAKFKQVEAAYEILGDPERKLDYDHALKAARSAEVQRIGGIDKELARSILQSQNPPEKNGIKWLFNLGWILTIIGCTGLIYPLFGAQNRYLYGLARSGTTDPTTIALVCLVAGILFILISKPRP